MSASTSFGQEDGGNAGARLRDVADGHTNKFDVRGGGVHQSLVTGGVAEQFNQGGADKPSPDHADTNYRTFHE